MTEHDRFDAGGPIQVGDYLIHRLIGEGGMARVYEGEEILSRRRVAVKVLRTELAHSEQVRRQFLTEMGILANLDDPNIVRCLLCTQVEGRPVMVLEFLQGWTLRAMLTTRVALPWQEMVRYAVQIAKALRTAHSRTPPIVHRDLKPENVMILTDGRVKVMDFGIAKIVQSMTGTTNHAVGTLQYMSPEHIDALPVDGRADLFALGLLMWEMLAGRPPFVGDSPRVLLERLCTHPTPKLPEQARGGVPPHVEALIYRLLEKDPRARPSSAAEVVGLLEPWTRPAPSRTNDVRPPAAPPPPRPTPLVTPLNTVEIVEGARQSPFERRLGQQADAIAEGIGRFASATSAAIVRVLLGLLALPVASLIFIGVPATIAGAVLVALEEGGIDIDDMQAEESVVPMLALSLLIATVVFIRACWTHRRPASMSPRWRRIWLVIGGALGGGWLVSTLIERMPQSGLYPPIHSFLITVNVIWLMISLSWATGWLVSRLFRRLERGPTRG